MAEPYVGEIRIFAGNFAPAGWWICDGSIMLISEYEVLFNLIGTTYGGDGQQTFALPDLRGRAPIHQGTGYVMGQPGGSESVTLSANQLPAHSHVPSGNSSTTNASGPSGAVWAGASSIIQYTTDASQNTPMNPGAVLAAGGSQPHENRPPFIVINYIIALNGFYPSQS